MVSAAMGEETVTSVARVIAQSMTLELCTSAGVVSSRRGSALRTVLQESKRCVDHTLGIRDTHLIFPTNRLQRKFFHLLDRVYHVGSSDRNSSLFLARVHPR